MTKKNNNLTKLPVVSRTPVIEKIFNSTLDQLTNEKQSEYFQSYIGRRPNELYNKDLDYYKPEPTAGRQDYQLEPTVSSKNATDGTTTNIKFYQDYVDYLSLHGANVANHERLFESDDYSWAPPIDIDKFINYRWYFWVENLHTSNPIKLYGMDDSDIIESILNNDAFTYVNTSDFEVELKSGLVVSFPDATDYADGIFIVEGVGKSISLIALQEPELPYDRWIYLPWDENSSDAGIDAEGHQRFLGPDKYDEYPWDAMLAPLNKDYMTNERGAVDKNAWSRTNSWVHEDTLYYQQDRLNAQGENDNYLISDFSQRALYPIIEFTKDITMYDHGTKWVADVEYILSLATINVPMQAGDKFVLGDTIETLEENPAGRRVWHQANIDALKALIGTEVFDGRDRIFEITTATYTTNNEYHYTIAVLPDKIEPGDTVVVVGGDVEQGRGKQLYWPILAGSVDTDNPTGKFTRVHTAKLPVIPESELIPGEPPNHPAFMTQSQPKLASNQEPLFSLYGNAIGQATGEEYTDISFEETANVSFNGSRLFGYKHNAFSTDFTPELGLYLTHAGLTQNNEIVFKSDIDSIPVLQDTEERQGQPIPGYYYFHNNENPDDYNPALKPKPRFSNFWHRIEQVTLQPVIDHFVANETKSNTAYTLSIMPNLKTVVVKVNANYLSADDFAVVNKTLVIKNQVVKNDNIQVFSQSIHRNADYFQIKMDQDHYTLSRPAEFPDEITAYVDGQYISNDTGWFTAINQQSIKINNWPDISNFPTITNINLLEGKALVFINESLEVIPENYKTNGFYTIPKSLESNFNNEDVLESAFNALLPHCLSIISNQAGNSNVTFGQKTNYANSEKDISLGTEIRQSDSNLVNAMLCATTDQLNINEAVDQAANEYTRFKNKYNKAVSDMINSGEYYDITAGLQTVGNELVTSKLFDTVISRIVDANSSTNAYKNTFLFPYGTMYEESILTPSATAVTGGMKEYESTIDLDGYNDLRSGLSIIETISAPDDIDFPHQIKERMLVENVDYEIVPGHWSSYEYKPTAVLVRIEYPDITNPADQYSEFSRPAATVTNRTLRVRIYRNLLSPRVPATPSILGLYPLTRPRIITDNTMPTPQTPLNVRTTISEFDHNARSTQHYYILGHDGSKTPKFNDERDFMLLELERRIYNKALAEFKVNNITSGYQPSITAQEIMPNEFRSTDYKRSEINEIFGKMFYKWANINQIQWRENEFYQLGNIWTYNMSDHIKKSYPGYWKGMYEYRYGTATPHLTPWECAGYADKPINWDEKFTTDYSSNNTIMWQEITGTVRDTIPDGNPKLLFDDYLPVDANGALRTPEELNFVNPVDLYNPLNVGDWKHDWVFGDGSPAVSAWKASSEYPFSIIKLFHLTKPARFSTTMWDTVGTVIDRRNINNPQIVSKLTGKREQRKDVRIHGEVYDNETVIAYGYQQWISDRLTQNNQNLSNYGDIFRHSRVSLGHKIGGFTVDGNLRVKTNTRDMQSDGAFMSIPNENYSLQMQTSDPYNVQAYSGVLVKGVEGGGYRIYGYDLETSKFITYAKHPGSTKHSIQAGGKDAPYSVYDPTKKYYLDMIVRHNEQYYRADQTHQTEYFDTQNWTLLKELPKIDALEAIVYSERNRNQVEEFHYGHQFDSIQGLVDFFIGYGAALEDSGWVFDYYDNTTNEIVNWEFSAKQAMYWVSTSWAPDAVVTISPSAARAKIKFDHGYPVSMATNNKFITLNYEGLPVDNSAMKVTRTDNSIMLETDEDLNKIYFMRAAVNDSEHVMVFDNRTIFNDILFDSVFNTRQERLIFDGFRSSDWTGKHEADGYLLTAGGDMWTNMDTNANDIRHYHDMNSVLDDPNLTNAARHMIGFESKLYLTASGLSSNAQAEFYKGLLHEKGTNAAINKVMRVVDTTENETINITEEWAIKLGEFGASANHQSFDLTIPPVRIKTDPQIVVLDTPSSDHGMVKAVVIVDRHEYYRIRPYVRIIPHPDDIGYIDWATAVAHLDEFGQLDYVEITHPGSGYTKTPTVIVAEHFDYYDTGPYEAHEYDPDPIEFNNDNCIAIIDGTSEIDSDHDELIIIDQDDTTLWHRRPKDTEAENLWPLLKTLRNDLNVPLAGYPMITDVDHVAYDGSVLMQKNLTKELPYIDYKRDPGDDPRIASNWHVQSRSTLWMARDHVDDWNVYRTNVLAQSGAFAMHKIEGAWFIDLPGSFIDGDIYQTAIALHTRVTSQEPGIMASPQDFSTYSYQQQTTVVHLTPTATANRYAVHMDENGTEMPSDIVFITDVTDTNIHIHREVWCLRSARFITMADLNASPQPPMIDELAWIDNFQANGDWAVVRFDATAGWTLHEIEVEVNNSPQVVTRQQDKLIDSSLFEQAYVYDRDSNATIFRLPVYDPFKGIFPFSASQNIEWRTDSDPTKYTVSDIYENINRNMSLGPADEGKVWWDTSTCAYTWYEQGSLTERRDNWGKMFPGSVVSVYEWTRSPTKPSGYMGEGTPRNTHEYVTSTNYDELSERNEVIYYFWVSGLSTTPSGMANRTQSVSQVAALLANPRDRGYQWFAPINHSNNKKDRRFRNTYFTIGKDKQNFVPLDQHWSSEPQVAIRYKDETEWTIFGHSWVNAYDGIQLFDHYPEGTEFRVQHQTSTYAVDGNSFIFNNIHSTVANTESVIQINYKYEDITNQKHVEWALLSANKTSKDLPAYHWDRFVDSMTGMTKPVDWDNHIDGVYRLIKDIFVSNDNVQTFNTTYANSLNIGSIGSPGSTHETQLNEQSFFVVPDPGLSETEKYGNETRPRQSWFKDKFGARQVFTEVMNELLAPLNIREDYPDWANILGDPADSSAETTLYAWNDWYVDGYSADTVNPTMIVDNVSELYQITNIAGGTQIRVQENINEKYKIFEFNDLYGTFELISKQDASVRIVDEMFTTRYEHAVRIQMRLMLQVIDTIIWEHDDVSRKQLMFNIFRYVLNEHDNVDWLFKTSYISVHQAGKEFSAPKITGPSSADTIGTYLSEIKPYRTKVRHYSTSNVLNDDARLLAENILEMAIKINVNNHWADMQQKTIGEVIKDAQGNNIRFDNAETGIKLVNYERFATHDAGYIGENGDAVNMDWIEADNTLRTIVIVWQESSVNVISTAFGGLAEPAIYVNGKYSNMFEYNQLNSALTILHPLKVGDRVDIYDHQPVDAHLFASGLSHHDLMAGIVPLKCTDSLSVTVETNPAVIYHTEYADDVRSVSSLDINGTDVYITLQVPEYLTSENTTSIWETYPLPTFFDNVSEASWDEYDLSTDTYVVGFDENEWDDNAIANLDPSVVPADSWVTFVTPTGFPESTNHAFRYAKHDSSESVVYQMGDSLAGHLLEEFVPGTTQIELTQFLEMPETGLLWVGSELVEYQQVTYNKQTGYTVFLSLLRGQQGTSIQNHPPGTRVQYVVPIDPYENESEPVTGSTFEYNSATEALIKTDNQGTPITGRFMWNVPAETNGRYILVNSYDQYVNETDNILTFTLTLDRPAQEAMTIRVKTIDYTAVSSVDYIEYDQLIAFSIGDISTTVNIALIDNNIQDGDKDVKINMVSMTSNLLVPETEIIVRIQDDE